MDRPPRFLYSKIVPRTAIRADGLKNADDFFDFLKACFIRCVFIEHAADGAERLTTAFTQQRLHRLLGNLAFIVDSIKQDGFFNLAQERGIQFYNVIPPSS